MSKISIDVPDDLLAAVTEADSPEDVEAVVVRALRREAANLQIDRLLREIAEEVGPIAPELAAEAEAVWRAS